MKIQELTFEVRDANLNRVGQLMPTDLVGWQSVLRFNNVGTWEITLEATHPLAEALSTPGAGIVVTHVDAGVILSGPTISAEVSKDTANVTGRVLITGYDDSAILAERLAYPTPATDDVTQQTQSHDVVTNVKSSTAMRTFVAHNCVTGVAPASRAVPNLTLGTDPLLGSTITKRARFDVLGELLNEIAIVDGLGFDIKQDDLQLVFNVFQPSDRTQTIRMDVANNTLASTRYGYAKPGLTQAIVAGQGDLEERQFIQVNTPESLQAQTLWKRRIEQFIDQRNTDVIDELEQAGLEALAESGFTLTSVDVVPSSDSTMRFGYDWNLGDLVTVVVDEQEVSAIVTEVAISVDVDGVHLVATVGEPTGVDYDALIARNQASNTRRINALERVESTVTAGGGGGGASVVVSDVAPANPTNGTIWFNLNRGQTFIWVEDGTSAAWVQDSSIISNESTIGTRVTDVELRSTSLETRATNLEARPLAGMVPIIPSSVQVGSGTSSVSASGVITFSGVNSIAINGVFSSAYANYRIVYFQDSASTLADIAMRLRQSGSDSSTANYYHGGTVIDGNTFYGNSASAANNWYIHTTHTAVAGNGHASLSMDLYSPNIARPTTFTHMGYAWPGTGYHRFIAKGGFHNNPLAYDGFTWYPSSGTYGGTIRVYGYN